MVFDYYRNGSAGISEEGASRGVSWLFNEAITRFSFADRNGNDDREYLTLSSGFLSR